jgi:hypothetical protein
MSDSILNFGDPASELKIHYNDSPDRERAGNGLESLPLINESLGADSLLDWWMTPSERVALIFLLEHLKPEVAIEIGTMFGGSLQALARFALEFIRSTQIRAWHTVFRENFPMSNI